MWLFVPIFFQSQVLKMIFLFLLKRRMQTSKWSSSFLSLTDVEKLKESRVHFDFCYYHQGWRWILHAFDATHMNVQRESDTTHHSDIVVVPVVKYQELSVISKRKWSDKNHFPPDLFIIEASFLECRWLVLDPRFLERSFPESFFVESIQISLFVFFSRLRIHCFPSLS